MPKHSLNSSNFDDRQKKNQYNIIVQMEKYNSAVLRLPVMNYTEEKKELGQKHVIPQINYCICKYQNFPHLSTYTKYLNSNVNFFFFFGRKEIH